MTLGSLFDGIGGFCLAGQYAEMLPIWSSEIEPFPIRVTEKRFPDVMQLGDVHALRGDAIPPVDVITFGSPCQKPVHRRKAHRLARRAIFLVF